MSKKEQGFHNFTKLSQTASCPSPPPPALSWTPNLHKSWEVITKPQSWHQVISSQASWAPV